MEATAAGQLIAGAALDYAARGWKVLPVVHRSKAPLLVNWPKLASDDEDAIAEWWEKWPDANVGVALGARSGIIDIEFDGEEGRATADRLFSECFTPTFTSGKSTHRLFRWRDDLPEQAKIVVNGLEVRSTGGQSVFPPSVHPSGAVYVWAPGLGPDDVDLQPIPDEVLAWLWNYDVHGPANGERRPDGHWERILRGVGEGSRNADAASLAGKLLRALSDVDDQSTVNVAWLSIKAANQVNDPPLGEDELLRTFTSILKKEKRRRVSDLVEQVVNPTVEESVANAVTSANGSRKKERDRDWKLVIVRSDPPTYELYAPQFGKADGGFIVLTVEQLTNAGAVRVQAIKQADAVLTRGFVKAWEGGTKKDGEGYDQGLLKRLMDCAEERVAPPEDRRDSITAQFLLQFISRASAVDEEERINLRRPCTLADGSVVFAFSTAHEELSRQAAKITDRELSKCLKQCGAGWYQPKVGEKQVRVKRLTREAIERLHQRANYGTGENPLEERQPSRVPPPSPQAPQGEKA